MNLKTNLQKLTREAKITPTELARLTGISKSVLHRFFNEGHINPTLDTLSRLSAFFKLSIDQLLGNVEHDYYETYLPLLSPAELTTNQIECSTKTKTIKINLDARSQLSANAFALIINNKFKFPFFLPGSTLIFDPEKHYKDQSYILYQYQGGSTVHLKQVIKINNRDHVKSLNSDFHEMVENLSTDKIILGVLVIVINQNVHYKF